MQTNLTKEPQRLQRHQAHEKICCGSRQCQNDSIDMSVMQNYSYDSSTSSRLHLGKLSECGSMIHNISIINHFEEKKTCLSKIQIEGQWDWFSFLFFLLILYPVLSSGLESTKGGRIDASIIYIFSMKMEKNIIFVSDRSWWRNKPLCLKLFHNIYTGSSSWIVNVSCSF